MTASTTSAEGRERVAELVRVFSQNYDYYKSNDFGETATRTQFIDPFLSALGWDVDDEAGHGPRRDVLVENKLADVGTVAGLDEWDDDLTADEVAARAPRITYPDYVLRLDQRARLVVEAKKPAVNLRRKAPAFQAKSYS